MEEAKALHFPLPLGSMAHQQFLLGRASLFCYAGGAADVVVSGDDVVVCSFFRKWVFFVSWFADMLLDLKKCL
jgi:hypothetical protein